MKRLRERTWGKRALFFMTLTCCFWGLSYGVFQETLLQATAFLLRMRQTLEASFDLSFLYPERAELLKMRAQNHALHTRLLFLQSVQEKNKRMRALLGYVERYADTFITAAVLQTPALGRRFLIGAGRQQGVEKGQIVTCEGGLVGRISAVSKDVAQVTPVTHPASKIPAYHKDSGRHALLLGTGAATLNVLYKENTSQHPKQGLFLTSTHGDVLPDGLLVAAFDTSSAALLPVVALSQLRRVHIVVRKQNITQKSSCDLEEKKRASNTMSGNLDTGKLAEKTHMPVRE